jgi:hypothetical protein
LATVLIILLAAVEAEDGTLPADLVDLAAAVMEGVSIPIHHKVVLLILEGVAAQLLITQQPVMVDLGL